MRPLRPWRFGPQELVFAIVLATGLIGGRSGFFNDPGTFWHVRLGREILQSGHVPRVDSLTSTRAGVPWVDQSWLFDTGLAWLVEHWGWPAVVAATALILAWIYAGLTSWLIALGTSSLVAVVVAVLAAGVGSIHFLARPHLFTFAFVLWTLAACRAYHDRGSRLVWTIPPVVALWGNLHGGFLAGPIIVATAILGELASGGWAAGRRRKLATFAGVFLLSVLAPLLNPYGIGLYRHVGELLIGSGVTELIDEYKSAPFGKAEARVLEWVVLGLIALPVVSRSRPSLYDLSHAIVWLHLALGSIRHAPLFAIAVSPVLACLLDGLPSPSRPRVATHRTQQGLPAWPVLASVLLLGLAMLGIPLGRPDPGKWPLSALDALNRQPVDARLFHEQDWGGLISSECRPTRAAYLDDRFELWGKPAILEYVAAMQGGPTWDEVRDRDGVALVWVKPDRGIARRLLKDSDWIVLYRDDVSILFRRDPKSGAGDALAGRGKADSGRVGR